MAVGAEGILSALDQLRLRLLDLTGRNRLLNFKPTAGKSLQFAPAAPLGATFQRLVSSQRVKVASVPDPSRDQWIERHGRMVKPDAKEFATTSGISTDFEFDGVSSARRVDPSYVQALYFADELGKHCRKLEREARLAIEETGANMLYLVLGFLEFPDSKDADRMQHAPLVCLPVRFEQTQEGQRVVFKLAYTGEEIEENLSLREKLKRDHQLTLPEFPDEEEGIEAYLGAVEAMVSKLPQWRIRRAVTLALLSFSNMLLVRDLNPDNWIDSRGSSLLVNHPIVRQLFQGDAEQSSALYAKEFDLDELRGAEFPIVFDADSSQHSALMDVMQGRSLVIEGPPGTGKSQTITNIIAACISEGKRVLFVAEKLAALQVVKSRLEQAGLDAFLMELHSNKTSRKAVLDSLSLRLDKRPSSPRDIDDREASLEQKKTELKKHSDLMKDKSGNMLGCSVHEILWRAERSRTMLGSASNEVRQIAIEDAPLTPTSKYVASLAGLRYLGKMFEEVGGYDAGQPFWGFDSTSFVPGDELRIESPIRSALVTLSELREFATALGAQHGFDDRFQLLPSNLDRYSEVLRSLASSLHDDTALDILPRVFDGDDASATAAIESIERASQLNARIVEIENKIRSRIRLEAIPSCQVSGRDARVVDDLGLGTQLATSLRDSVATLESRVSRAHSALEDLRTFSLEVGVAWDGSHRTIQKLVSMVTVAGSCPTNLLDQRHAGLATHNLVAVIDKLASEQQDLIELEAAIGKEFYLDQPLSDESLRAAILVLREGKAWYRWFQPKWRGAVALHASLQRKKQKKDSDVRLADLERMWELRRCKREWIESPILKRITGPSYSEFKTDFEGIRHLAAWLVDGKAEFAAVDLSGPSFDLHSMSKQAIEKIASSRSMVVQGAALLAGFAESVTAVLPNYSVLSSVDREGNPGDEVGRVRAIIKLLAAASDGLESVLTGECILREAFQKVELSRELLTLREELASSRDLPHLLGDRLDLLRDQIPEVSSALKFGQAVRDAILPTQLKRQLWSPSAVKVAAELGGRLGEMRELWKTVESKLAELGRFGAVTREAWIPDASTHTTSVEAAFAKFSLAVSHMDQLVTWCQYTQSRGECLSNGLEPFVLLLERRSIAPNLISHAFAYCFHASIAESLFRKHRSLAQFKAVRHNAVRAEYRDEDRKLISLRGRQIAAKSIRSADPPQGTTGTRVDDKSEMHLIEYLRNQVRPRVSVRTLLRRAASAIQELKPCFMMGPQAVAQFLQPGAISFDLIVMDEASQMRPEEAIGAIARGGQLVVVGDPKQLPPTSFFSRAQIEGEDYDQMAAVDAESILDVATTHFRPVRSLRWHYRSRHESLIAFSNAKFYNGKLIVFPSPFPRSSNLGVRSHFVAGAVYESQINQLEAARTVDFVVDHIVSRSNQSLGVVTLNIRQRDLIAELLEERLKSVEGAIEFRSKWEKAGQPLFVKNLENVQGDERDSIIVSTTFGRPPGASKPHQNFGPISQQGGWRRLNVLFTRARSSILVVTSLKDTDVVVVPGSTPKGTEALRDYLAYASTGVLRQDLGAETDLPPESEFEESVISVLTDHGFNCVPQVGVAGFRIDVGVRHPEFPHLFLAGIECDGATYHSGITVRDRDRIRQEILESLGWEGKLWRIWSTEWFRNPVGETKKLLSFLNELRGLPVDPAIAMYVAPESASTADDPTEVESQEPLHAVSRQALELITDSVELEVQVDDLVTYVSLDTEPDREVSIRICKRSHDPAAGIIAAHTPLAETLLGALVNEEVILRIPAQPDRRLKVVSIQRSGSDDVGITEQTSRQPPLFS